MRPEGQVKYTEKFIMVNTPKNFQKMGTQGSIKFENLGWKTESLRKDTMSSD
jgi:hypothetical protein